MSRSNTIGYTLAREATFVFFCTNLSASAALHFGRNNFSSATSRSGLHQSAWFDVFSIAKGPREVVALELRALITLRWERTI